MGTREFVNWSRTVRSRPRAWVRPPSEEAVAEQVRRVRARGGRVRVVGSGHSWSPVAAPDDVALRLDDLDRIVAVDPVAETVTVQGGCTLATLNRVLPRHGLALPILGSIDAQTVAGAIATGTHGSSLRHGNLGTLVRGLTLVDGTGARHRLGPDDPRLDGARTHLGALGVVTEVTLAVRPAFRLRERIAPMPVDQVAERVASLGTGHAFVKVWWMPHTDQAWVFTYEETDDPAEPRALADWADRVANRWLFPGVLAAGRLVPALIPWTMRGVAAVHFGEDTRVQRSDRALTLAMPPRHRETELAVPLARGGEAFGWVVDQVRRQGVRLDFITELRFVAGDDGWASPAHGRDTVQLGLYGTWSPELDGVFQRFAEAATAWDGRPHWGKEDGGVRRGLIRRYPRGEDFVSLARTLDPDGVFRNPWLDAVLDLGA